MGTFIVVDVTSHVISQKPLERELLSTVSALIFLSIGNVLSFAVIQKLHLSKIIIVPRIKTNTEYFPTKII